MGIVLAKRMLLVATSLGGLTAVPAIAQDGVEHTVSSPADIIVTARRVEERLQDVPISMTVYDQEAISARNIVNSADLAVYTPSLSVNSRYGPEKASFAIRGFVQDFQTAPSVGVYFADVVAPRGASTTTGGNGVGVGSMFDLQNVQVLKGPQGTLFGRNTTGGAVILVPNRPTSDLEGYVEGALGNLNMRRLQGVINIPLAETFKVRLGVDRLKRDGILRNRSGIGPERLQDTNYISARLSVLADLTPDLENYTIASYSQSDTDGTSMRMVGCKRPDPSLPNNGWVGLQFYGGTFGCAQVDRQNARGDGWWDVENSVPNPKIKLETWQVINTTAWRLTDNVTIRNIISYAEMREDSTYNIGGDNFIGLAPVIAINSTPGYHYGAESTFTEELQVQGDFGNLTWQAGGYFEKSNPIGHGAQSVSLLLNCANPGAYQCDQGISFDTGGASIPVSNLGQQFYKWWWSSKAVYGQATYNINDNLNITGGLRYTWDSQRNYNSASAVWFLEDNEPTAFCSNPIRNPGSDGGMKFITPGDFQQCDLEFEAKSQKPTWTIDLQYKPISDVMVYAKWSRGYRAGGVNTPYVFFETWGPEKVEAYEVGAKTSFRGSVSGYFNIAGFYNDFSDQQIQVTLSQKPGAPVTGGTGIVNAGKSRIWGIELDAAITLFDSLKLEAGYTYLNTKLLKLVGIPPADDRPWVSGETPWAKINPTARVGGPLSLSPKNRVQLSATYTLPLNDSIGQLSVGATFVHTDKQIANNATAPEFGILPASDLLNLNVGWKDVFGQPLDLSLFVTNVANEKFPVNVANFYDSFGFESQIVNEPRTWGVRMKYRYGY